MKIILILSLVAYSVEGGSYRNEVMSHRHWRYLERNQCGLVKIHPRITKGAYAKISRFPWMVQVLRRQVVGNQLIDKYVCTGALINKQYAVTAAHCIQGRIKAIRLGESVNVVCSHSVDDCSSRKVKIEEIIIHEQFNKITYENDIALLRLDEEIRFHHNVLPICMPRDDILDDSFLGEKVDIAGWGVDSSQNPSQILKYVTMPIRDRCVCETIYNRKIHQSQLCVGVETGEDTCNGDSGSPVVWKRQEHFDTRHYMIGLTSFGDEYCGEGPAVYTNLNPFMKWILDNMYGSEIEVMINGISESPKDTTPKPQDTTTIPRDPVPKPQDPVPKPQDPVLKPNETESHEYTYEYVSDDSTDEEEPTLS